MKPTQFCFCLLAAASVVAPSLAPVQAQTAARAAYEPLKTFAPLSFPDPVNMYRSANGAPGPQYWQQRADYSIDARIDTQAKVLSATEVITYTNNSPDTLDCLWLQLEQNIYKPDSRSNAERGTMGARRRPATGPTTTDGYQFDAIELLPDPAVKHMQPTPLQPFVSDTRMQLRLPAPLPHGGRVQVRIRYHYAIPGLFGGRTSWGTAKQGEIYDIAQWYPRMAVFDDLHGWDTQPYLGNEFYCEYGRIDYAVTVPSNFLVNGSGELMNPANVLTKTEQARLAQARTSDKTVTIRTAEEAAANAALPTPAATKTWRFSMDSTRDAVFTASPVFMWDAARMNIPAGPGGSGPGNQPTTVPAHAALAQSVYPTESAGPDKWGRSTEYLKDAVEHFSQRWFPYPYPNAVNVAGFSTGMEYPGVLFDGIDDAGKTLFWITAHEIGHTWFPMIVGFNERRNAWMDEGFNTFIDIYESDDFEGGLYGPKRDGEYAPGGGYPADEIAAVQLGTSSSLNGPARNGAAATATDPLDIPIILTRADAIKEKYRHPITYFKSAFGLRLLREDILGPERFDFAFRKFIRDWAFRHPSPSDFFRAMASEGGEDLDYFWRGWYFNNWTLDMAVTSITWTDPGDHAKGVQVTVANLGQLVLPATLRVQMATGPAVTIAVPAETWLQNATHTFTVPTANSSPISATLDPDHHLPDIDRSNNTMSLQ